MKNNSPQTFIFKIQAILGGRCVDTNEDLGPPLTNLVRRYVSVAGANRGSNEG